MTETIHAGPEGDYLVMRGRLTLSRARSALAAARKANPDRDLSHVAVVYDGHHVVSACGCASCGRKRAAL